MRDAHRIRDLCRGAVDDADSAFARNRRIVRWIVQKRLRGGMEQDPESLDAAALGCVRANHTSPEEVSCMISTTGSDV